MMVLHPTWIEQLIGLDGPPEECGSPLNVRMDVLTQCLPSAVHTFIWLPYKSVEH